MPGEAIKASFPSSVEHPYPVKKVSVLTFLAIDPSYLGALVI